MGVHRHLLYVRVRVCVMCALYYTTLPNSNPNCELRVSKIKTKLKLKLKPARLMCHVLHCETPARCEGPSASAALNVSLLVRQAGGCG